MASRYGAKERGSRSISSLPPEAIGEAALDFPQLSLNGGIERAPGSFKNGGATIEGWVWGDLDRRPSGLEKNLRDGVGLGRVNTEPGKLLTFEFFKGGQNQAVEGFGIDSQLTAQNTAGDGEGKLQHVGLGFPPQPGAQDSEIGDGGGKAFEHRLEFGHGPATAGGFSFAKSGRARRAKSLFESLLTSGFHGGGIGGRSLGRRGAADGGGCGPNGRPHHRRGGTRVARRNQSTRHIVRQPLP